MNSSWPKAVAQRLGIAGEVDFTTARVGQTLHIRCSRGGHVADFLVKPGQNPDAIAKMMLHRGWTIGRKITCPEHGRKSERPKTTGPQTMEETKAKPTPSEAAKKAHRMLMMALEDYYDDTAKQYREGYSDARLASEIGCSEQHVKETREQYFGPLNMPNEVAEFRTSLANLRGEASQMAASIAKSIDAMQQRLDRLCKRNGWVE